ncbi:MAG: hypothetical protein M5U09_23735 [Gammaproteobacteria bacterium]|nr:hypothetical protein [Gammaproteobacteria bacterium]
MSGKHKRDDPEQSKRFEDEAEKHETPENSALFEKIISSLKPKRPPKEKTDNSG